MSSILDHRSRRRKRSTLQGRITAGLALVSFLAWAALALVMVVNARVATGREVEAAFFIAERFVRERVEAIENSDNIEEHLATLLSQLEGVRHVSMSLTPAIPGEELVVSSDSSGVVRQSEEDEDEPPALFAKLIRSTDIHAFIPVVGNGERVATVVLSSDDSDEIAEVWEDFRFVLPLMMVYGLLVSLVALLYVGTVFRRLRETSRALVCLREGQMSVRLPEAGFAEFAPVTAGFNELAASLVAKTRSNQQLANRLLTAHEEERRRLANDLHDELGPNLFSARASLSALKRAIGEEGAEVSAALERPLDTLEGGLADVQVLLRRILSQLKPMSIGSVPLATSIENLASDYRRTAPNPLIDVTTSTGDLTFGETIDLTIHRFVGEGILNALRHGGAGHISIVLELERDGSERWILTTTISDNGSGPAENSGKGIGLSGVRERVETLGGCVLGPERRQDQTVIVVQIPAGTGQPARMVAYP